MENTLYITTKNLTKLLNAPYSKKELEELTSYEKINEHPPVEKLNTILNIIHNPTHGDNNSRRVRNYFLLPLAVLRSKILKNLTSAKTLISNVAQNVTIQKTTVSSNLLDLLIETNSILKNNGISLICCPTFHGILKYNSVAVLIELVYNPDANDTSINLNDTLSYEHILNAELKAISLLNENSDLKTIAVVFYDPNIPFQSEFQKNKNNDTEEEPIFHPTHYLIYTKEALERIKDDIDGNLSSNFKKSVTNDPELNAQGENTVDCGEGYTETSGENNNINFNNFYRKLREYIKSDIDVVRIHTNRTDNNGSKGGRDVAAPKVTFMHTSTTNEFGNFTFKKLKTFQNIFLGMSIFKVSVEEIYDKKSLDKDTGELTTSSTISNESTIHLGAIYNYHRFYQNIKEYFINETTNLVQSAISSFNIEQESLDPSERENLTVDKDKIKFIFLAMMAPLIEKGPSNISLIFRTYSNTVMKELKKELKNYLEENQLEHPNNTNNYNIDPKRKLKMRTFIDKFIIQLVKTLNNLDQTNVMLGNSINSVLFDIATSPIILGKFFRLVKVVPPVGQNQTDLSKCLFVFDFDNRLQLRSSPNYSGTIFFEDLLEKLRKGIKQYSNLDRLLSNGYAGTMIRTQFRYLESSVFSNLLNEVKDEIDLDSA